MNFEETTEEQQKRGEQQLASALCYLNLNGTTYWLKLKKKVLQILEAGKIRATVNVIVWLLRTWLWVFSLV
jgi:hypothetical protein